MKDPNLSPGGVFIISACRVNFENAVQGLKPVNEEGRRKRLLRRGTRGARLAIQDPLPPPAKGYRTPTMPPRITNEELGYRSGMYKRLKGPSVNNRIQTVRKILYTPEKRKQHRTLRSVLSAAGVRANFGSTHPDLLSKFQKKFKSGKYK
jgi:hypothetical protein